MLLDESVALHIKDPLEALGYVLAQVQHRKDPRHQVRIVVTIQRKDGEPVTIRDCVRATKTIKVALETHLEDYLLEVSSPGAR